MTPCAKYDGTGRDRYVSRRACSACWGRGLFPAPDMRQIVEDITTARGAKGQRRFRLSATEGDRREVRWQRAYYVWHLARFHGGADVCMPVMAEVSSDGDPYRDELDKIAEAVARQVLRTDLAAAHRWGRALGSLNTDVTGLPASAYQGGPTHDKHKPAEEMLETVP